MTVRLTRRVSFSSGHRYWRGDLDDAQNRALFGKWASPFNHGHNYVLEVETSGSLDPVTGMVVNIKDIDDVLQERVVATFDQKSLNDETPYFVETPPTLENMLHIIAGLLDGLPEQARLDRLTLHETPTLYATWENDAVTLTRTYEFAASHRLHVPGLPDERNIALFGKCNNPNGHGHNYLVDVEVGGLPDPETGMICDLAELDRIVDEEIVDRYDHKHLNTDVPELVGQNPTSEVVALAIFHRLAKRLPWPLVSVKLHETARNAFEVRAADLERKRA